jgi:hypothetical protein
VNPKPAQFRGDSIALEIKPEWTSAKVNFALAVDF